MRRIEKKVNQENQKVKKFGACSKIKCIRRKGSFLVLYIVRQEAAEKHQVVCPEFKQLNRKIALIAPLGPGPKTFPLGFL